MFKTNKFNPKVSRIFSKAIVSLSILNLMAVAVYAEKMKLDEYNNFLEKKLISNKGSLQANTIFYQLYGDEVKKPLTPIVDELFKTSEKHLLYGENSDKSVYHIAHDYLRLNLNLLHLPYSQRVNGKEKVFHYRGCGVDPILKRGEIQILIPNYHDSDSNFLSKNSLALNLMVVSKHHLKEAIPNTKYKILTIKIDKEIHASELLSKYMDKIIDNEKKLSRFSFVPNLIIDEFTLLSLNVTENKKHNYFNHFYLNTYNVPRPLYGENQSLSYRYMQLSKADMYFNFFSSNYGSDKSENRDLLANTISETNNKEYKPVKLCAKTPLDNVFIDDSDKVRNNMIDDQMNISLLSIVDMHKNLINSKHIDVIRKGIELTTPNKELLKEK